MAKSPRQPSPVVHRNPNQSAYTVRHGRPYNPMHPNTMSPPPPSPAPVQDQVYPWPPPLQQQPPPLPEPPLTVPPQGPFFYPYRKALPNTEINNPWTGARDVLHAELRNTIGLYPFLDWDITNFPSASIGHKAPGIDAIAHFRHSATNPGCTTVQIYYTHPTFSPILTRLGPISVYPVGDAADIKVEDIMNAVYHHFQQPITVPEWKTVSWQEQEQISASFRDRIRNSFNLFEFDVNRGPLRIDALKGCTRFAGLQIISFLNHSGEMYMKLVPL